MRSSEQNRAVDMRNGVREHLKIRLGYRYSKAENKRHAEYERKISRPRQRRSYLVSYLGRNNNRTAGIQQGDA